MNQIPYNSQADKDEESLVNAMIIYRNELKWWHKFFKTQKYKTLRNDLENAYRTVSQHIEHSEMPRIQRRSMELILDKVHDNLLVW